MLLIVCIRILSSNINSIATTRSIQVLLGIFPFIRLFSFFCRGAATAQPASEFPELLPFHQQMASAAINVPDESRQKLSNIPCLLVSITSGRAGVRHLGALDN